MDEKTGMKVGSLNYNLSSLMEKNNLEIKHEPFDLEEAGRESKIILSMVLKVHIKI